MGVVANISADRWPKQGDYLLARCQVCFNYDSSREFSGTIVRHDMEEPWRTIIRLDDGRVVLASECMYSPESRSDAPTSG